MFIAASYSALASEADEYIRRRVNVAYFLRFSIFEEDRNDHSFEWNRMRIAEKKTQKQKRHTLVCVTKYSARERPIKLIR